jgi:DNA recombination protein RmuC
MLMGRRGAERRQAETANIHAELRARAALREEQIEASRRELETLRGELHALGGRAAELQATLEQERRGMAEKQALLDEARTRLSDAFKALSADALKHNGESFLALARATLEKFQESARGDLEKRQQAIGELVKPMRESIEKFDGRVREIEQARTDAYARLTQQIVSMQETQQQLRGETASLVKALGTPQVRGRWGELTLRRVVELAGMQAHCDFEEQVSMAGENDDRLRPDLVVRLPSGRSVAVDAKAPLTAYLEASEATDDAVRTAKLADHARRIREHIRALTAKNYWERIQPAPEFVVLFLPGEQFYSAALQADPSLIEWSVGQRVILATPTTLIALLKAVSYGWKQEALAVNARQIADLGRELYKRLTDMSGHLAEVGDRLGKATQSYNRAIGSFETRVLVSARRFETLEADMPDRSLDPIAEIEVQPRLPGSNG